MNPWPLGYEGTVITILPPKLLFDFEVNRQHWIWRKANELLQSLVGNAERFRGDSRAEFGFMIPTDYHHWTRHLIRALIFLTSIFHCFSHLVGSCQLHTSCFSCPWRKFCGSICRFVLLCRNGLSMTSKLFAQLPSATLINCSFDVSRKHLCNYFLNYCSLRFKWL